MFEAFTLDEHAAGQSLGRGRALKALGLNEVKHALGCIKSVFSVHFFFSIFVCFSGFDHLYSPNSVCTVSTQVRKRSLEVIA